MTNWLPNLTQGGGPLYLRLADRIEHDIENGVLPEGAKLPPQRNLAFDLGVTIGTVSRAYALVRERGLINGEVGRGTYVLERAAAGAVPAERRSPPASSPLDGTRELDAAAEKLRFDATAAPDVGQGETIAALSARTNHAHLQEMTSYTRTYPEHWLAAGSRWLARGAFRPSARDIVPTLGAHAAVVATIAATTSPGDHIAFEHLTYSQVARSASLIGRRITLVETDTHGMVPEDLERVCAQRHPKMVFLMPAAQNPTVATLPRERRIAIAEIVRKHNVWLIEDNLYGALAADPQPVLAELAPERTFHVGGLSKSVAAGVRGGWIACPPNYARRVQVAHRMLTGGLPFMLTELSAQLVLSGEADAIREKCIAENNARLALARRALSGYSARMSANVPFIWLELPEPWLSGTFKNAASEEGVLIDDADEFKAGRSDRVFHHVRIGISAPRSREETARGLSVIRRLMEEGSAGYDSLD
ncbi:PLP-dependent aminotransferase family protein [Nitratireductor sp. GCM10026969]|uniref:aminotransferase-like domain-containing protein n=1 Tax=Nitratireductor sp. GCM10026969 TaxID=3252645 RepID=UPI003622D3DF